MIDRYRFELLDSEEGSRLRWFSPNGDVKERVLDQSVIESFAERTDREYETRAADLDKLGSDLYRWLDGPTERWLAAARSNNRPFVVELACSRGLRHLPWELLHDSDFLAVDSNKPVCPVRRPMSRTTETTGMSNRPLRVLFMASSPVNVQPVLRFEEEEAAILSAGAGLLEVVVEDSGSLEGLRVTLASFGPNYFDVLHLSGHATISEQVPQFVLENEIGERSDATAEEIAEAVGHLWPPLVFLSGCHTGGSGPGGEVASMAEALVEAGAPLVLGWALPVGDVAATALAAVLYGQLASGESQDWAVIRARRTLFDSSSPYWHLLRLYSEGGPMEPLVTPPATAGRTRLRARPVRELFLDATGQIKVAADNGFVGRRRQLQRCLRDLRPADPAVGTKVLILHGMGGLGKSTLAARLLSRMRRSHPHQAVWVGKLDSIEIAKLGQRVNLDVIHQVELNQLLSQPDLPLAERLRLILDGPLADEACLFVFDDFESGNLEDDGDGAVVCTPEALEIVEAFASAITRTASPSRLIITSRYDFPLPAAVPVSREPLMALQGVDLDKKLQLTTNLGPTSTVDDAIRLHGIEAAGGIPRLIEWIDQVLGDAQTDHARILDAIRARTIDYREGLLARELLTAQSPQTRRALAFAAIYEIPVPIEAIDTLAPDEPIPQFIERAVAIGLIDRGINEATREDRYLVSNLIKPLLQESEEALSEEERSDAYRRGARFLFHRWAADVA